MTPGRSTDGPGMLAARGGREAAAVGIALLLLGVLWTVREVGSGRPATALVAAREAEAQDHLAEAGKAFADVQRAARRLAVEVGQRPEIIVYLDGRTTDRRPLFDALRNAAEPAGSGIELYDAQAELVAWHGQGGEGGRREVLIALAGQMTSFVVRTAVSSQLFLAVPVRHEARVVGAVVVRTTIDVASPLRNRFLGRTGLAEQLGTDLGTTVQFDFPPAVTPAADSAWRSAPLYGIDSTRLGDVRVALPPITALEERTRAHLDRWIAGAAGLLTLMVALVILRRLQRMSLSILRSAAIAIVLWGARSVLAVLDVPGRLFPSGLFDPMVFAASFGNGLARSPGDLTLTVLTLLFTFLLAAPRSAGQQLGTRMLRWHIAIRTGAAAALTALVFLLLRGTAAAIRSLLFDSSVTIGDPAQIMPVLATGVILLNGIVLVFLFSAFALEVLRALHRALGWPAAAGLFVAGAVLSMVQSEPLMGVPLTVFVVTLLLAAEWADGFRTGLLRTDTGDLRFHALLFLSALIFIPLLDGQRVERDRNRVETFAAEVLRPVDGWLTFIVEDGLQHLVYATGDGDRDGIRSAALRAWAQSLACREGYTAVFEVLDTTGAEISHFAIGGQSGLAHQVGLSVPLDTAGVFRIKSIGDGVSAVRVYAGSAPLFAANGGRAGHVRMTVAAGEQQVFRGDNPAVLRGTSRETLESFYRPITITEYRDGLFLRSTSTAFPFTHVLPEDLRELLPTLTPPMLWRDEEIGGIAYETFYALREQSGRSVVGLSMERQPVIMRFVGLIKVVVLYLLIILVRASWIGWRRLQAGVPLRLTFRDRLIATMLAAALVPLAVLLVFSQMDVRDRMIESTADRLEEQTDGIAQDIAGIGEHADASSELEVRPDRVELIASNAGTDFNLYVGTMLRISSRPELYTAGLLDPRISGSAYAAVVLGGRWFTVETEHIGQFRYIVGYRPVLDAAGGIIGVVSVPTVFRQDEMERGLVARHAVLFGVYAVVLVFILLLTPLLAHRFASPVLQLTALARSVGKGDLDIRGRLPRADGEIGELIHAFDAMTREIAESRDSLVKAERELAWKEMAQQVAHEIKNPLTPMKLSVQHLRRTFADRAPDFDEILDRVTRTLIAQIDALSRIASAFSSFARMPHRTMVLCAPAEVVREAVALFRDDTRVTFSVREAGDLPGITADVEELRRAFINIIRNGVQAMGGEGAMEITLAREGGMIRIRFTDHGHGIPEDLQPRLFEPRFSTKSDGMGLGLAIVKKTIDDLGGTVRITSAVGAGTTVELNIPAGGDVR